MALPVLAHFHTFVVKKMDTVRHGSMFDDTPERLYLDIHIYFHDRGSRRNI